MWDENLIGMCLLNFYRCITFHPSGACLFAASSENLRVHGWEPPEMHDTVPTSWSKIQDIAMSHDQLVIEE